MKRINLKQVNWMKALKIAGGGVAAILLAEALGLQMRHLPALSHC